MRIDLRYDSWPIAHGGKCHVWQWWRHNKRYLKGLYAYTPTVMLKYNGLFSWKLKFPHVQTGVPKPPNTIEEDMLFDPSIVKSISIFQPAMGQNISKGNEMNDVNTENKAVAITVPGATAKPAEVKFVQDEKTVGNEGAPKAADVTK